MFKVKNHKKIYVEIYSNDHLIYSGKWDDLPLREELIIKKSIAFFNDPEPCYIHRDAVRVRLLAELEEVLKDIYQEIPPQWLDRLTVCTGFSTITQVNFLEK